MSDFLSLVFMFIGGFIMGFGIGLAKADKEAAEERATAEQEAQKP